MVKAIRERRPVREAYLERLLEMGGIEAHEADEILEGCQRRLEAELERSRSAAYRHARRQELLERTLRARGGASDAAATDVWASFHGGPRPADLDSLDTAVPRDRLEWLLERLGRVPEGFEPSTKLRRRQRDLRRAATEDRPISWACAEALAFASLATAGIPVRLTGQDSERGTFSQRHAVLHDAVTGARWFPLGELEEGQAAVTIANSPLSEAAVLGFEYGHSLARPDALTLWEAQFGDFANCAQVLIDQFLVSAEEKWHRLSGLVMLLPHGLEGQGPEHSSARVERFLALAVEDNIQVAEPSTAAQYFHLLRRQALTSWRKPLVVLTPKGQLHTRALDSSLDQLATGRFRRVVEPEFETSAVQRILLCTGGLRHQLESRRPEGHPTAILGLEELSPLPTDELARALARYPADAELVWVQAEPANMGAWPTLRHRLRHCAGSRALRAIHRPPSSTPATGSRQSHELEEQELIRAAFASR
jgi:2-oxoglutarate dehydrogenase E1 component